MGPDSPDGESKQKGITTPLIGAELNCLRILRKISVDVEFVAINGSEILAPYFSTDPSDTATPFLTGLLFREHSRHRDIPPNVIELSATRLILLSTCRS